MDQIKPNYQTNYLVLKIVPNDISYLTIKIDNPIIEYYDLHGGNPNTFNNLNANTTYFFIVTAPNTNMLKSILRVIL